ncbi:MAG: biopolymer transporter ExbD [Candidatus Cloacimonetes bacterium]|nr:biopolymer transporter ExbD [Candidatus Cloacimonadota bacterium]
MFKKKSSRAIRRKFPDVGGLSITSLLDILTIMLVFLIKNVSVDAQRVTVPENMIFPPTITNDELLDNGVTIVVKLYQDRILLGNSNLNAGTLADLVGNKTKREMIFKYMKDEAVRIINLDKDKTKFKPCLLIQADKEIPVQYVTELIKLSAGAYFENIYFSTLEEDWLKSK